MILRKIVQMPVFVLIVLGSLEMGAPHANATCTAPSSEKLSQVKKYVIKRFRLPSAAQVVLTDSRAANDACFWLLTYESSNPGREITVYLSPDGNYISPALYDVRTDPLAEEAAERAENQKALLAGASPELGGKDAPLTIVEFADFQCPYCKRMADVLRKDFLPAEGTQVHYVFKNYPLPMHSWAMAAAEMAECVTLQKPSEFWKIHDFLFDNQAQLTAENLKDKVAKFIAANTSIDPNQFEYCVENDLGTNLIKRDVDLGRKLRVHGTPSIFINGALYTGYKDADQLRELVTNAEKGYVLPQTIPVRTRINSASPGEHACPPKSPISQ